MANPKYEFQFIINPTNKKKVIEYLSSKAEFKYKDLNSYLEHHRLETKNVRVYNLFGSKIYFEYGDSKPQSKMSIEISSNSKESGEKARKILEKLAIA